VSSTIVDLPKVAQMLDAGWVVSCYRDGPSYTARATHKSEEVVHRAAMKWAKAIESDELSALAAIDVALADFADQEAVTDDFTPEQALTRLAYKVHGEYPPDAEGGE
jgi:hypothetical protein